ncbi:MAG TPA: endonuclease MutS2, partial [Pseudobdellovibrionaceae bacterium]|nr:endonuclease MutS2 [Pseudobdellovibrionaceae bacterium]
MKNDKTPFQNLDWLEITEKIKSYATSLPGKDFLNTLNPLKSPEEALTQFQHTKNAQEVLEMGVRPFMQSLDLYEVWKNRLNKSAVLKTIELKDVRSFCLETLALSEALKDHLTTWAEKIKTS